MTNNDLMQNQFLLYKDNQGDVKLNVLLQDETIWLTQKKMGELFQVETNTINYHLKEIFKNNELIEDSTVRKIRIVQNEGNRSVEREPLFYNLDAIIAVGYRVNSKQATQFRIWATGVLKEFIIKGFVLDEERLKNGTYFGKSYFKELLAKIKDIRTSERLLYQQLKDIYSLSVDYDKSSRKSIFFYANVQNKVLYAITGNRAAKIVYDRVDSKKSNVGLTSWKNEKIRKTDVVIAKNYLQKDELEELKEIINMFLDFAERQARKQQVLYIKDWDTELNRFLEFHKLEILKGKGNISQKEAIQKALQEYNKFREIEKLQEKSESIKEVEYDIKELEAMLKKEKCN